MTLKTTMQMKWLWLKRTAPFNWAHKPLCSRFASDVIHVFGLHVCRSCTAVYLGCLAAVLGLWIGHPDGGMVLWPGIGLSAVVFPLSAPKLYKRWPRWFRDILRFSVGAVFPFYLYLGLNGYAPIAATLLLLLAVFWRVYFSLRGKRKSRACDGCEHLSAGEICPGYALQAVAIRKYEQEATDIVVAQFPSFPHHIRIPGNP